ncbi:37S ribosomal protein S24, mitochondrial [Microsporum canis]|uniref:Mitochondrial ribosomal protein subunit S24 n=1 Tax=Arthroderma otae (strain ATCC MYA-4605 / CBS 113480) TaxID=554155 RepID=C5FEC0_ARTOC|nr:mitochondrial 37S ribosome protein domain-containing protein [Microsporum canis CBS 113480]EEQ28154.1 mitochondrial ribosomal protein subunit S24 [Microsporum canis CBS 113480]
MAPVTRPFSRLALSCSRQATSRCTSSLYTQQSCWTFRRQPFSAASTRLSTSSEETEISDLNYDFTNLPELEKQLQKEVDSTVRNLRKNVNYNFRELPKQRTGYWGADDEDDLMMQVEDGDDEFHQDDMTSMAHAELEEHRELREYARIVAWDMPSLSALAKPFTLPPQTHVLRFRQTTYLGETHPAETKIVVELCSKDLTPTYLTEEQRITLLKLVGPRYNPDTDIIHMSCEKFPTRAQNKRYLGDLVNTLIKEAKEGDSFADIPLVFPHHKPKKRYVFPESWNVTEESKKQIEAARHQIDDIVAKKGIVDGNEVIAQAAKTLPALGAMNQLLPSAQTVPVKKGQKSRGPKARN